MSEHTRDVLFMRPPTDTLRIGIRAGETLHVEAGGEALTMVRVGGTDLVFQPGRLELRATKEGAEVRWSALPEWWGRRFDAMSIGPMTRFHPCVSCGAYEAHSPRFDADRRVVSWSCGACGQAYDTHVHPADIVADESGRIHLGMAGDCDHRIHVKAGGATDGRVIVGGGAGGAGGGEQA